MTMTFMFPGKVLVLGSFIAAAGSVATGQSGPARTVKDQVYSDPQATRGKSIYNAQCSNCHDGGAMGPALSGGDFLASWDNKSVRTLFDRVLNTMPSDAPGTLQEQEALDLMAYLIKANGFPSGPDALKGPDELNAIAIVRSK